MRDTASASRSTGWTRCAASWPGSTSICAAQAKRPVYRIGDKIVHDGWELTVAHATLATYAGRGEDKSRYVEVAFVLRDVHRKRARPLTIVARRPGPDARRVAGRQRPVGLPVDVLGERVLAEGAGWRFDLRPRRRAKKGRNERGLAVPMAVTFRIGGRRGRVPIHGQRLPAGAPWTFRRRKRKRRKENRA